VLRCQAAEAKTKNKTGRNTLVETQERVETGRSKFKWPDADFNILKFLLPLEVEKSGQRADRYEGDRGKAWRYEFGVNTKMP
jgi:hypothetical protein